MPFTSASGNASAEPEGSTGVTRLLPAMHRLCAVLLRHGLHKEINSFLLENCV